MIRAKRMTKLQDQLMRDIPKFTHTVFSRIEYLSSSIMDPSPDGFSTDSRLGPRGGATATHTQDCPANADGECDCGAAAEESSSTESNALRRITGKRSRDPQETACRRIEIAFVTMTKELDAAAHAWQVIIHCADSVKGRQTTLGVCRACHRDDVPNVPSDRIRSGYCSACFKAWTRTDHGNGRMDRLAFEHTRQLPTVEAS